MSACSLLSVLTAKYNAPLLRNPWGKFLSVFSVSLMVCTAKWRTDLSPGQGREEGENVVKLPPAQCIFIPNQSLPPRNTDFFFRSSSNCFMSLVREKLWSVFIHPTLNQNLSIISSILYLVKMRNLESKFPSQCK
jgi:hypothetical protein